MQRPEQRHHLAVLRWWSFAASGFKVDQRALLHVPNGGKRNVIEASILKAMGVRAGCADLLLIKPSGSFNGLCLELKAPKGRLSIDQGQMLALFESCGWQTVISWSFDESVAAITNYLNRGNALSKP